MACRSNEKGDGRHPNTIEDGACCDATLCSLLRALAVVKSGPINDCADPCSLYRAADLLQLFRRQLASTYSAEYTVVGIHRFSFLTLGP